MGIEEIDKMKMATPNEFYAIGRFVYRLGVAKDIAVQSFPVYLKSVYDDFLVHYLKIESNFWAKIPHKYFRC